MAGLELADTFGDIHLLEVQPRVRMSKESLLESLRSDAPSEWKKAATAMLTKDDVVFAGSELPRSKNKVSDLLRLYRMRLDRSRSQKLDAFGLSELVECLSETSPDATIEVEPFLGPAGAVTAFWDTTGKLVGCVTVKGQS
jgi:hypothetical protein